MPAPRGKGATGLVGYLNSQAPTVPVSQTLPLDKYYRSADLLQAQARAAPRRAAGLPPRLPRCACRRRRRRPGPPALPAQACAYRTASNDEQLYVMLMRLISLVVETIPRHRACDRGSARHQRYTQAVKAAFAEAERLKVVLCTKDIRTPRAYTLRRPSNTVQITDAGSQLPGIDWAGADAPPAAAAAAAAAGIPAAYSGGGSGGSGSGGGNGGGAQLEWPPRSGGGAAGAGAAAAPGAPGGDWAPVSYSSGHYAPSSAQALQKHALFAPKPAPRALQQQGSGAARPRYPAVDSSPIDALWAQPGGGGGGAAAAAAGMAGLSLGSSGGGAPGQGPGPALDAAFAPRPSAGPSLGPQEVEVGSMSPAGGHPGGSCALAPVGLPAVAEAAAAAAAGPKAPPKVVDLRDVHISVALMNDFLHYAAVNTRRGVESCGILAGRLSAGDSRFTVTTLIVPKQTGTSDTVEMLGEEEVWEAEASRELVPLGWIHTHPTQSCFLSSVDIHTQCGYQTMLEEAVAIVMAPTDSSKKCGIFRLTVPAGLAHVQKCGQRGFHAGCNADAYELCGHVYLNPAAAHEAPAGASSARYCAEAVPAGYPGLGGSVVVPWDCRWRPAVHFVATLTGKGLDAGQSALAVPVVTYEPGPIPTSSSGPARMVVSDLVLSKFALTDPAGKQQVLWPVGLLQPGVQPGSSAPRRLYLQDVQLLVDAGTLQAYLRFFRADADTLIYTDNATFVHVAYWADDETFAQNVGLLLDTGLPPSSLAGAAPAAGLNYVLPSNAAGPVAVLRAAAAASTALPLLVYVASNVSLAGGAGGGAGGGGGLPINRPVFLVGRVTVPTGVDFGMAVNGLLLLGPWSAATLAALVLENLAPGDARSAPYAGNYSLDLSYNVWPFLFPRSSSRLALHNCSLVLSALEVEEYLYRATLFKVQPAGFDAVLAPLSSEVSAWDVTWEPDGDRVWTDVMRSTAMTLLDCNVTSTPLVAPRLPLPARAGGGGGDGAAEPDLLRVDARGVFGVGAGRGGSGADVALLTSNLSFATDPALEPAGEAALRAHLRGELARGTLAPQALVGIVDPPITVDMGYSIDLVALPPDAPAGALTLVNAVLQHLGQGAAARAPGADMQTPEVWTHLLWAFPRAAGTPSVVLSNVTVWVPAAEYSYIRSFTGNNGDATSFVISLSGGQAMRFDSVVDMGTNGLAVAHYTGPGLEAHSMRVRLEAGWNQDGPPEGFWNGATPAAGAGRRLSDSLVVVLAVCLVIAVVVTVLAILAVMLWRRRNAEALAAAAAAAELKAGSARRGGTSDGGGSGGSSGVRRGSGGGARGGGLLALSGSSALLDAPVHDSSDSYPLSDRAALTVELARSQLGGGEPHDLEAGGGRGPAGGTRSASMVSDACLQRLHSAITTMSQDVLSRRLHVANGNALGTPTAAAAAAAAASAPLGRPSPLGALAAQREGGEASGSQHAAAAAATAQQQLARDSAVSRASGSAVDAASGVSSASLAGEAPAADGGAAAEGGAAQLARASPAAGALAAPAGRRGLAAMAGPTALGELKLLQLVGQGTFGQVYKALWRRRCVAVKVLQLPASAGSGDVAPWMGIGRVSSHREKMAVMEAVVSTTMSHPNIVQVYTYVLQPLTSPGQRSIARRTSKPEQQPGLPALQQQLAPELRPLQDQLLLQQQAGLEQPRRPQLQQQQAQQQQAQQQPEPPPAGAGANGQAPGSPARGQPAQQQQQQQQEQQQQQQHAESPPLTAGSNVQHGSRSCGAALNDSSQSLAGVELNKLNKLTPEMAAAAAAALPAAAGGASGAGQAASSSNASSDGDRDGSGGDASRPGPVLVGWELRLVMEFCDAGSLRTALDHKLVIDRTTGLPALECVLFLAHDVACAMIHLHSEHLLHGDLKASNVLLKRTAPRLPVAPDAPAAPAGASGGGASSGGAPRRRAQGQLLGGGLGLMAKVADFGLSLTLGPADTHVSQMHMGTLTHMAPELLLHGRASKASDVYAYGILLWELSTGRRPYSGTPVGMLAHKVAQQGWRPAWPGGCCQPVTALAEACWAQEAGERPCFEDIVQRLEDMAAQLDALKHAQAQQMAAAAAPLHGGGPVAEVGELGHELTPSLMEEFMPSGFSGGSAHSGSFAGLEDGGALYEMSQLSGASQDREHLAAAAAAPPPPAAPEG
ncbi:AMSH1 [Scenedesmus sp. PABB004]|nr:AMSH1 [Scenedesmus sp. PABB004]